MSRVLTENLNHLFFRVVETDGSNVGEGTEYPIGVPFGKLYEWMFRVKSWRIQLEDAEIKAEAEVSATSSLLAIAEIPGSSGTHTDYLIAGAPAEEYLLVTLDFTGGAIIDYDYQYDDDAAEFVEAEAYIRIELSASSTIYHEAVSDLYYPHFALEGEVFANAQALADTGSADSEKIWRISWSDEEADNGWTEVVVDFDGYPLKLWEYSYSADGSIGSGATAITDIGTPKVTIAPYEYWEYDPDDGGGPVWDKDTGAKLRRNYI